MKRLAIVTLACLTFAASGSAAVIHVPADHAQIHDAVQAAAAGDTVMVAAGTYTDCTHETEGPGSTPACVIMKDGVTLIGAGPDATIIDAEELGRGIFVEDTDDVRIENLQVRRAYAAIYGAGILIRQGSTNISVSDCAIRDNGDGGIIVIDGCDASFTAVDFVTNVAKQGGGLAVEEMSTAVVENCTFDGNTAPSGAGMFVRSGCTVTITGSVFHANVVDANTSGGGITVKGSHCDISGSEFTDNACEGIGGGLAYTDGATGTIEDCLIAGNSTTGDFSSGGGIACQSSGPTLRHLVIVGNSANGSGSGGGGIDVQFGPAPTIEHCTLVGNGCDVDGLGGGILVGFFADPSITNCIIADSVNGAGISCGADFPGNPLVTGCDLWNNAGGDDVCGTDGGCNFSADPLFCNPSEGNYGVALESPCAAGNHPAGGDCGTDYVGALVPGCGTPVADLSDVGVVLGNAPNPFNPTTTVFFVLDAPGDVVLRIHDVRGRTLRTFRRAGLDAGTRYEVTWNGRDESGRELPSGVYLYQLETHGATVTKRMSLIR